MPCSDRLSQWSQQVSSAFGHLSPPASVGPGPLERGDRAVGSSRDHATQCSARVGVGPTGTSGVSTLARVVSGCEAQKREKTPRAGRDHLLRSLVAVDRASVGNWKSADGPGAGCHHTGGALDDFDDQRGDTQLRHSGGVESAIAISETIEPGEKRKTSRETSWNSGLHTPS
jgi:hypothetical protein